LFRHLALRGHYPFWYIVHLLAEYSTDSLITEFLPVGICTKGRTVPDPVPEWYTLENSVGELKNQFSTVEIIPYAAESDQTAGTLLLCQGKMEARLSRSQQTALAFHTSLY
jgi:hypothetical protein